MEPLTSGSAAAEAGVNVQTLRYYERRGLIPSPPRKASGYRAYDAEHVSRVRFIKRAQDLGFTLAEIEELLDLRADPDGERADVRARTQFKIEQINRKVADLLRIRDTLASLVDACDGHGSTSHCPILAALDDWEPR